MGEMGYMGFCRNHTHDTPLNRDDVPDAALQELGITSPVVGRLDVCRNEEAITHHKLHKYPSTDGSIFGVITKPTICDSCPYKSGVATRDVLELARK